MNTIDRYILRQLITVTFLGVLSLTLLMLLGQLFKELHTLLVESGAPPSIVIDFILQVIPFSLTFSVPWGFLTAVLLVYGRLAADNELTSMRMAGLSLWRLSRPAIGMGLALSCLCYYINIEIAPKGKRAMGELVMNAAMENPRNLLTAGGGVTKLDGVQLYIEGRNGDMLHGVHIYPITESGAAKTGMQGLATMHAQTAFVGEFNRETRMLSLILYNAAIEHNTGNATNMPLIQELPLQIHIPLKTRRRLKANRLSNIEINEILSHWDIVRSVDAKFLDKCVTAAEKNPPAFPCAANLWEATRSDLNYYKSSMSKKTELELRTEGIQRASFACACLVFSLIGVPLAITARRKDTSTGFALGIIVAAVYFVSLVFCELSRKSSGIAPYIVLWVPNVLCAAFAIWQHAKAKYRG